MAFTARQAIACILLIFSLVIHAQSQSASEKSAGATVTGKITIKGKGASGVLVGLFETEPLSALPRSHKGSTDVTGVYRITNVPPGTYRVQVMAPAFVLANDTDAMKTLLINKDETIENFDFALLRGGAVTGKVTNEEGHPVIEADVSLVQAEWNGKSSILAPLNTRTDDRGIYRIFGVPAGKYNVAAGSERDVFSRRWRTSGYLKTVLTDDDSKLVVIEVTEGSESSNADIVLGRPITKYSARGRIVDGDTGQPLANVPYGVLLFMDTHSSGSMSTGAVSNRAGEFRLENLAPGNYAVYVETPPDSDWRVEPVRFEVSNQDVSGLTVKTSRGGSISGVLVLEGTDDKAAHAKLMEARLYANILGDGMMGGHSSQSSTIKPDGTFHIRGLQAGLAHFFLPIQRFTVTRVERNGVVHPGGIEINQREHITGVRITVTYGSGSIRGVVKLADDKMPANARFSVFLRRITETPFGSNANDGVQVDARGQFAVTGLLPGTYEVNANLYDPDDRSGNMPSAQQQVVVNSGAVATVTLTITLPRAKP